MKHIIILPGTCAHWSNWFDQIDCYESLGYRVDFLELNTYKHSTFVECVIDMFDRLGALLLASQKEVQFPEDEPIKILGHSMGAMILLKILSDQKFFQNRNPEAYELIRKSKLVFIQIPLKVNLFNVKVLSVLKYLAYPFFIFHRYLIFPWMTPLLLFMKVIEKKVFGKIPVLREIINLTLNACIMHNAFWGTSIKEFAHSNKYYRHWDAFSLSGINAPTEVSDFERATMGHAKSSKSNFDSTYTKNYYFTYGFPDFFCGSQEIIDFAKAIGANYVEFTPNNHLPHHMFWNQKRFNELVLSHN